MTEKTEDLIAQADARFADSRLGKSWASETDKDLVVLRKLRDRLSELSAAEAARLRDLEYPEYVPESVTDAAYDSQRLWWTPAENPEQRVIVPTLIESVAEAAYRATVKHLNEVTP